MPKAAPSAFGYTPQKSCSKVPPTVIGKGEVLSTPTVIVYGEVVVELGGKVYIINAPEGATIRERINSVQS